VRRAEFLLARRLVQERTPMKYRICAYELLDHVLVTVTSYDLYGEEGSSRTRLYTFPGNEIHVHRLEELLAALAEKVQPQ
jgi:hypothetical protein